MSEFFPTNNTLVEYFIPSRVVGAGNISYALTSALSSTGEPWYTEFLTGKVGTVNISKSLSLYLNVINYSQPGSVIANGSEVSLGLSVTSGSPVTFHGYVGNFTNQGNFTFNFSSPTGNGSFDSVVTIRNEGALAGVYLVTITARTSSIAVSKIVEVNVP